jgi:hypothetical protein
MILFYKLFEMIDLSFINFHEHAKLYMKYMMIKNKNDYEKAFIKNL